LEEAEMSLKPWLCAAALGVTPALLVLGAGAGCSSAGEGPSSGDGGGGDIAEAGGDGAPPLGGVVAGGVRWFGRVDVSDPAGPRFSWSGSGFVARFSGTSLSASLKNDGAFIFKTVVDGAPQPAFTVGASTSSTAIATGLPPGTHVIELYRQTEGPQGNSQLLGLDPGDDGTILDPPPGPERLIEVVGDSISCGYGILGSVADSDCYPTESHWDAYPSVVARALGSEVSTVAASGRGVVRNYAGDTVDTMPMIYDRVLANAAAPAWDFHLQPQVVIINLGTNDISNGKGDPGAPFRDTYLALVEAIRARYPTAFIVAIIGPLTSASEAAIIQGHIQSVVDARHDAGDSLIELFSQIAPQTSDKFACSYHPNVAENLIVADLLVAELRAKLGW
jgi:lysophospholipase L1-like esterase